MVLARNPIWFIQVLLNLNVKLWKIYFVGLTFPKIIWT